MKLNRKFTVSIAVLVFIPLALFSMMLFREMRVRLITEAESEAASYVTEKTVSAQKTVEMCNMSTKTFLNTKDLQEFITRVADGEEIGTKEYLDFSESSIAMLERQINSNPYLYHICVYVKNNSFPEMVPILYHWERAERQTWFAGVQLGEWQFDYPDNLHIYSRMNESEHLMALVSDFPGSDGESAGIIEVAVSMEEVFPRLYDEDTDSWACLLMDDGRVYTGDKEMPEDMRRLILEEAKHMGEESRHVSLQGEDIVITVRKIDGLGVTYVQADSLAAALARLKVQRNVFLAVLLVLFIILVLVINRLVKRLLRRFYRILGTVREVRGGDLSVRVPVDSPDEMGEMGRQINRMLDRIQELMQENIDREVLMKNTEIKALQNQINAHFIYNVLESVKMMAEISEEYEISDAVTALGELLRYSMKWVSGTVRIGQELQYIRNYIQLMNLRYDFTIQLSVSLPDFVYDQQIPKMSLQPIIENAICHGIEDLNEDATIYIKSVDLGGDYLIEITDSGIGMTKEQLDMLEKKLRGEIEVSGGSGNGIGLKNVQDRIQIQFGKAYGLSFYSKEGCYTKVSIRLPRTEKTVAAVQGQQSLQS